MYLLRGTKGLSVLRVRDIFSMSIASERDGLNLVCTELILEFNFRFLIKSNIIFNTASLSCSLDIIIRIPFLIKIFYH